MSRKDYIAIAAILAGDFATATWLEKGKVFAITLSLADYFAKENPHFDRAKFYAAVFDTANLDQVRAQCANPKTERHSDFNLIHAASVAAHTFGVC